MLDEQKINKLTESSKIGLRRAFGKSVEDISLKNSIAFYSVAPEGMTRREEQNLFFAVTLYCYYREKVTEGKPFTTAVSDYYSRCTESSKRDLESIMDSAYGISGTFFHRLYSLIKRMEAEGIYVNANDLFYELQYWDSKGKDRKKKIARNIVHVEEEETK